MRAVVLAVAAGCGFHGPVIGDAPVIDTAVIDAVDGPPLDVDGGPDAMVDGPILIDAGMIDAEVDAPIVVDAAPDAMADAKIMVDAAPDATIAIDAPSCPASYPLAIGTSHYRIIATDAVIGVHNGTCNNDQPGRTHLVAIDSIGEMTTLIPMLGPPPPSGQWFVGNVQQRDQATPSTGWLLITGGPLPMGLWATGQPDDLGGGPGEDNTQNISSIQTDGLHDNTSTITGGAVCECDGKPPDPTASALIP